MQPVYAGDRNTLLQHQGYGFAVVEQAEKVLSEGFELMLANELELEKHVANFEYDYAGLYQEQGAYDPLIGDADSGIAPFYTFATYLMFSNCDAQYRCMKGCDEFEVQFAACNEPYNASLCYVVCDERFPCDYSYQNGVFQRQVYRHTTVDSALAAYTGLSAVTGNDVCNQYYTLYNTLKCNEQYMENLVNAIVVVRENNAQDKQETQRIDVDVALPIPLTATSLMYYSRNYAYYNMIGNPEYACSGAY